MRVANLNTIRTAASFARVMGRLWEPQGGEFILPMETGDPLTNLKKLFVVPQKIHVALG